ncbi:MAG TPA: hypothetical protein ENN21_10060, partial [Spirochaetes bacterium]|nr:hypothetical protein [Spirochaetota bacterium]
MAGAQRMKRSIRKRKAPRRIIRKRITRRGILTLLGTAIMLNSELLLGGKAYSAPPYSGKTTDHFDGTRFFNPEDDGSHGFKEFWKWFTNRQQGPWPKWVETPQTVPPERVDGAELRLTYVNHSTFLIQTRGLNILTDPVWSYRVSPFSFAGPRRHRSPGVTFENLPPIDIVLISHNHYDHMDMPTLKKLNKKFRPKIYTGLGCSHYLKRNGIDGAVEMDWWDSARFNDETVITFLPARHFSQRGTSDRNKTLWGGFAVTTPEGPIYFAGDTGMTKYFAEIRKKIGSPRLALLPIGAYKPRWFMKPAHTSPDDAVDIHE